MLFFSHTLIIEIIRLAYKKLFDELNGHITKLTKENELIKERNLLLLDTIIEYNKERRVKFIKNQINNSIYDSNISLLRKDIDIIQSMGIGENSYTNIVYYQNEEIIEKIKNSEIFQSLEKIILDDDYMLNNLMFIYFNSAETTVHNGKLELRYLPFVGLLGAGFFFLMSTIAVQSSSLVIVSPAPASLNCIEKYFSILSKISSSSKNDLI